jgi:hypothetical protein
MYGFRTFWRKMYGFAFFLYHGQYLGFFEKFRKQKKKERKEQESHLLL